MKKTLLLCLIAGTLGTLVIGIFTGDWIIGAIWSYLLALLSSIVNYLYKKNKNKKQ